jgi:MFS family permease
MVVGRDPPARESVARLFAEADFLRLWGVGLAISVVRWLETLATALFVHEATGSAFLVAMMTMLRLLPMGLFGAFLGVWTERVEQRTSLLVLVWGGLLTSLALALLASAGMLAAWHLAVASFLGGLVWAADNPVRRLMIGQVVGAGRMGQAMSVDVGTANASRMLGPALGGVLFAAVGIGGAFALGAALQVAALAAALGLRYRSGVAAAAGEGMLARLSEGLALARRDARLRGTLVVTVVFNVFGWPFGALIPVIGRESLGLSPGGVGVLASMDGAGAFLGALLIGALARPARYGACYLGGVVLYQASITLFALAPQAVPAGLALLANGIGQAAFAVMQATLVYLAAPAELRSRALGVLTLCIGLGPVGFLHIGLLAELLGARWACALTGLEGLLALALTRRLWWPLLRPAEEGRR